MPDDAPAVPANTPAPNATPAPAAPVAANPQQTTGDEPWLKDRLARAEQAAQAKLLAELGVDDPKKAKAAVEAARKLEEEQKTAADKAAEAALEAKRAKSEAERYKNIAAEHAARMMAVLTPEQKAAVEKIAADDPAKQLEAIGVLGPTWAKSGAAQPLPGSVEPPPANTAPPANSAPAPASPGSPPNHKEHYTRLRSTNPFEAAAYGLQHAVEAYELKD